MWRLIAISIVVAARAYAQPLGVLPAGATVAQRAEFYQQLAQAQSTAALEGLARALASSTDIASHSALEATLLRYYELDPGGAVVFAGALGRVGGVSLVATLREKLAQDDANAALSSLSLIDDPDEAREAALATLRGLGGDQRAYALVMASLRDDAAQRFRADAILPLARTAPGWALTEVLRVSDTERRASLALAIVDQWALESPRDALSALEALTDLELRARLREGVLRNWREVDSLSEYVAALAPEEQRQALLSGALDRIIQLEPALAAQIALTLPANDAKRGLIYQISASLAQLDPAAGLAWARQLEAPDRMLAMSAILQSVAQRDPLQAFDLAVTSEEPLRTQALQAAVSGPLRDPAVLPELAVRLLNLREGPERSALIAMLLDSWSRSNTPAQALDWMVAHSSTLPVAAFERVAYVYAQTDPTGAVAQIDRVPREVRGAWLGATMAVVGAADPERAANLIERFRGDPAFDPAAVMLAQQMASRDPVAAARLLASVSSRSADGAAPEFAIASAWAQRDPRAAAEWALNLPLLSGNMALSIVTGTWALTDGEGMRDWAIHLAAGERRDAALTAVVRARGPAPPDGTLLAAFSDDRARQGATMNTILATAQVDAAAARQLIDGYITDPRMRAQAEQLVDGFARGIAPGAATGLRSPLGAVVVSPFTSGAAPVSVVGPNVLVAPNGLPIVVRSPAPGLVPVPAQVAGPSVRLDVQPPSEPTVRE